MENRVDFTIANLKARTVYCVKARELLRTWKWNSSSEFSDPVCERTQPGQSPPGRLPGTRAGLPPGTGALHHGRALHVPRGVGEAVSLASA